MKNKEKIDIEQNAAAGIKTPISHDKIFKIMKWVTLIVASVFLLINIIKLNVPGIVITAVSISAFLITLRVMKQRGTSDKKKEFVTSIVLQFIAFCISLNSGESYSDDFSIQLAIIGMTGMYMNPKFTKTQIILAEILFVFMYIINPAKGGAISQYILCMVMFTLAAVLFFITISRGRAFIDVSKIHARESEKLLASMRDMGEKLQYDFESSSYTIAQSTSGLRDGSTSISDEAAIISSRCNDVQDKIRLTESQVSELNLQVRRFESALSENQTNMEAMKRQLRKVTSIITQSDEVFQSMKVQMNEVADIAHKLGDISFKTTLLSLNASVEAANAGSAGAGFAVVAGEMKELSENSDAFSIQVSKVVRNLIKQVERTSEQFADSTDAIQNTEDKMTELQQSFVRLTNQFDHLYGNIDEQNSTITQIDNMFYDLQKKIAAMRTNSEENQNAVNDIAKAMDIYRNNIERVIDNTKV